MMFKWTHTCHCSKNYIFSYQCDSIQGFNHCKSLDFLFTWPVDKVSLIFNNVLYWFILLLRLTRLFLDMSNKHWKLLSFKYLYIYIRISYLYAILISISAYLLVETFLFCTTVISLAKEGRRMQNDGRFSLQVLECKCNESNINPH